MELVCHLILVELVETPWLRICYSTMSYGDIVPFSSSSQSVLSVVFLTTRYRTCVLEVGGGTYVCEFRSPER